MRLLLLPCRNCIGMASSSGIVGSNNDPLSDMEEEVHEVFSDRDTPECEGVPRLLWTTNVCLYTIVTELQWVKGFVTVSNPIWFLGVRAHLGTCMWQSRYQGVLSRMSFRTIGGTLSGPGQSSMYFLTVPAFSTMRGVTSSIVEE
jgi:hypothetical protein